MKKYTICLLLTTFGIAALVTMGINGCIFNPFVCSPDGLEIRVWDDLAAAWYHGAEVHVRDLSGSCGEQLDNTDQNGLAFFGVPSRGGTMNCYVVFWDQLGQRRTTQLLQITIRDRYLVVFDIHINTNPYIPPYGSRQTIATSSARYEPKEKQ